MPQKEPMLTWQLPKKTQIGGVSYEIHGDFRDILEIFSYLLDPNLPEPMRWRIALALFYEQEIPPEHRQEAMAYLAFFINCGRPSEPMPGPKLLDWEQDADLIVADVNRTAGQEIRALPFVHWWTFMAWFNAIGEGRLSMVVSIREKLRKGKKLEPWEKEFYRENKARIDLKKPLTEAQLAEKRKLEELLA